MRSSSIAAYVLALALSLVSCGLFAAARSDVILALDSSLSMRANDPDRDSIQGAELFCNLLGPEDRLSVMSFDVDARALIPMTRLSDAETRAGAAASMRGIQMDGRRTNFEAALRTAYRAYGQASDDTDSQRVLVLFTDGQLNLGSEDATTGARERIMRQLIPEMRAAHIHIYGVAFSPDADLELLRIMSAQTGGFALKADTPRDIYTSFLALFEQTDQPLIAPIRDGQVKIDSDVRSLKLLVSHGPNDSPVQLTDPSSHRLTLARSKPGVDWQSSPHFDHITIQEPQAGYWEVSGGGADQRAYLESDLDLTIEVPRIAEVGRAVTLGARLTDRGRPIGRHLAEGLRFTAKVAQDGGDFMKLVELPTDGRSGSASGQLDFDRAGTFRIEITAQGPEFQRSKVSFIDVAPAGSPLARLPDPGPDAASQTAEAKTLHKALFILLGVNAVLVMLAGLGVVLWRWRARVMRDQDPSELEL